MVRHASVTRCIAHGLVVAAGVSASAGALAQSRTIVSVAVPIEVEHDSNPNLAVDSPGSTTWTRATPSITANYVLGVDTFSVEAGLTAEHSSNQQVAKDRLDPRVRAAWRHEAPRDATELEVFLDRSALRSTDVAEQSALGVDGARTLFGLRGSWRHEIDERTGLETDVRQEWQRFTDTTTPDFRRTTASLRYTRQRDERQAWYAGIDGQLYDPDAGSAAGAPAAEQRSHAIGALVGISRSLSEAWRLDVGAGPVHFGSPSTRTSWQGALKLDYTGERWTAGFDLARAPGVNSTVGGLVSTDEARLRLAYDLDGRSRIEMDASHAREAAARSSRSLASVAWVRQWTPSWQVAVRASTHRREGTDGIGRSNRIAVVLTYTAADF